MNRGYAICLNEWLDDKRLKSKGSLELLIRITSIIHSDGSCYASNDYFAEEINQTPVSVSRKIKQLERYGYINIKYKKRGAEVTERMIVLSEEGSR